MQVEKVLGIDTPAYKAGLKSGDVLVEVQGELITMMTHPQVTVAVALFANYVYVHMLR